MTGELFRRVTAKEKDTLGCPFLAAAEGDSPYGREGVRTCFLGERLPSLYFLSEIPMK